MNSDSYGHLTVNSCPTDILRLSLKKRLANRIQKIVDMEGQTFHQTASSNSSAIIRKAVELRADQIPIRKVHDTPQLWYVSAIAFRLEKQWEHPAVAIAQLIVTELLISIRQPCDSLVGDTTEDNDSVWHESTTWTMPPGWIHWRLHEPGIAAWLGELIAQLMPRSGTDPQRFPPAHRADYDYQIQSSSSIPFVILYTHARCHVLLRLGVREGLIPHHSGMAASSPEGGIHTPYPYPWHQLNFSDLTTDAPEARLLAQLVWIFDELADVATTGTSDAWQTVGMKGAIALSQEFQRFEAACRIFGPVKTQTPVLAQARLGLVQATQLTLQWLLESILGIPAPTEL